MTINRTLTYAALVGVLLTLVTGTCVLRMFDAREAASRAKQDLVETRTLAAAIQTLRQAPQLGPQPVQRVIDFSRQLEHSLAEAGLDHDYLVDPAEGASPSVEVEGEQRIPLTLQNVTVQQAIQFARSLANGPPGTAVRRLHLTAPQDALIDDQWRLDLTIATPIGVGGAL